MQARASYYYAGGERVPLEVDDAHVAVDLEEAAAHGLEQTFVAAVASRMSRLPGGRLVVLPRSVLPRETWNRLEQAGALQPVFRAGAARIVAFPEVRIHAGPGQRPELLSAVEASGIPAEVGPEREGDIVVRPRSGRGVDALTLANFVYEKLRPAMAQARFVRIVPRPETPQAP